MHPLRQPWHMVRQPAKWTENRKLIILKAFIDRCYMTTNTDGARREFEAELSRLVVSALNLDPDSTKIDPVAPLFGDAGLGLDSIDILEISLTVSKQYGIQLRSDDENSKQIFASLRSLGEHIQQHRTK